MMVFVLMVLAAWVFVFLAVRVSRDAKSRDSAAEAVDIHKDRLAGLETQRQQGDLDEEDYRQFRAETERALLEDTRKQRRSSQYRAMPLWVAGVLLVVVSGASFALYAEWGASEGVAVQNSFRALASLEEPTEAHVREAMEGYRRMLRNRPEDIEGWYRLASMQMEVGDYESAQPSLEHVLELLRGGDRSAEDESTVLAYLGQSLWAQKQPREALQRFEEALQFNAQNTLALGFSGRLSYELGEYRKSIDYWMRLKRLAQDNETEVIDGFIERSQAALREQGIEYEPDAGIQIEVDVSLPAAWEGLPESAALFIYARPVGGRMPLAVKRLPVTSRELSVNLSDADAMGPMGGLSGQDSVEVMARVSFKGVAESAPGDWVAKPVQLNLNDQSRHSVQLDLVQP